MQSCFKTESAIHEYAPEYVPNPIAWGSYKSDKNAHFLLAEFVEMKDQVPAPEAYVAGLVALHSRSIGEAPDGRFGFPILTGFGNLEQTDKWEDKWGGLLDVMYERN